MLTPRTRQTFERNIATFIEAIEHCHKRKLYLPQLTLIYTLIDQMAFLALDGNRTKANRTDFKDWVNKYVLPNSGLPCNAVDIYGSRCSILHTGTAVSDLSKRGEARQIWFYYPPSRGVSPESLDRVERGMPMAIHVDIDQLGAAVFNGIELFIGDIDENPDLARRVNDQLAKVFTFIPIPDN